MRLKRVLIPLLDFFFPCKCKICNGPLNDAKWVCKECILRIKPINTPFCTRCGLPLSPSFLEVEEAFCKECRTYPRYFYQARYTAFYEGVMKECIHLFKYERKISLAKPLGELMVRLIKWQWDGIDFDLIVPVPLHSRRKRERGFNQAELLAQRIKELLSLPIDIDNLIRTRFTQSQTTLSRRERLRNVRFAFKIRDRGVFDKKMVLLIDDIFTTGATINECARVLKEAGSREVYALALARTPHSTLKD